MNYLGLGKTKHNSSICLIQGANIELLLTERFNKIKNSGAWPSESLNLIKPQIDIQNTQIAENRDVIKAKSIEAFMDLQFPFFDFLKKNKLDQFSSHFNLNIENVGHHLAHAYAVLAMSPFYKSIIVVMDGAGSQLSNEDENEKTFEECSVYLQDGVDLKLVYATSVQFKPSPNHEHQTFSDTIGFSYEKISEFIFNTPHSSGKVMGLAPFGVPSKIEDLNYFLEKLPWANSFKGKGKAEWEKNCGDLYKDLSASIQRKFEETYDILLDMLRIKYPDYENLILTGGCALNCTNNARIFYQNKFNQVYIPPFPGDESIGFGLAHFLKFKKNPSLWEICKMSEQSAYFGFSKSAPTDLDVIKTFSNDKYEIRKSNNISKEVAELLYQNNIIAWFQGRSETGPRALGNRSILANPLFLNLKKFLNDHVKFRENFRPYGCSVIQDKAHIYFNVPENFDNPYMSYALKVREPFKESLKEVSHIDGTSRMQTVRISQNKKFYELIEAFGNLSNMYCLLNTSLNVMEEPILETIVDAKIFMDRSVLQYIVINDFIIINKAWNKNV